MDEGEGAHAAHVGLLALLHHLVEHVGRDAEALEDVETGEREFLLLGVVADVRGLDDFLLLLPGLLPLIPGGRVVGGFLALGRHVRWTHYLLPGLVRAVVAVRRLGVVGATSRGTPGRLLAFLVLSLLGPLLTSHGIYINKAIITQFCAC